VCGIVGSVRRGGCLDEITSVRMRDSLAHRGPDDAGLWRSEQDGVTLGSRRLAILDLSPRGHMPMQDASGDLTITFNGEIYNCLELRHELEKEYAFRSQTDTEVLLAAYSVWGTDCLEHLNGMFAFAIWDNRRKCLFAARDRFGEKPFFYFHDSSVFLFASEIKAILASGMLRSEPNLSSIYRFMAYRETDATEETFFKNIWALRPAHALVYSPASDSLKIWEYWDLDPAAETRCGSDGTYAERLHNLLQQSVKIRLRSDVPLGSCLSGGIDSSSIVGLMAEQREGNSQSTFSARFNDPLIDEGQFIQPVAEKFGASNYSVFPDANRMLDDLHTLAWHQEHPFVGPSIYAQWCVMRLAKEKGVTVLLDGQGADESLGGYLASQGFHCRDLFMRMRWVAMLKSINGQVKRGGLDSLPAMLAPQLPDVVTKPGFFHPEVAALTPDFRKHAAAAPTQATPKFKSALHNELYQQLRCSMLPKLLRFADRSSMAFSREVRLPFLDHRVVEYLFAIPEDQKIRGAVTKFVLRNAMRGKVPEKILKRTDKKGFEAPQSAWLSGPLRGWADEIFHSHVFRERGWADQKTVLATWRRFLSDPSRNQAFLFRWLSLEVWAREFLKPSVAFQPVYSQKAARASASALGTSVEAPARGL
jgi:asparagine synthase (glutamine-hydrolysing)